MGKLYHLSCLFNYISPNGREAKEHSSTKIGTFAPVRLSSKVSPTTNSIGIDWECTASPAYLLEKISDMLVL